MTQRQKDELEILLLAIKENKSNKEVSDKLKRKYRAKLFSYQEKVDERIIIDDKNGYGWYELYDIWFKGTREEALEYLYDVFATPTPCSAYDCTGNAYTAGFRIAHKVGNMWRVCETVRLDI